MNARGKSERKLRRLRPADMVFGFWTLDFGLWTLDFSFGTTSDRRRSSQTTVANQDDRLPPKAFVPEAEF